MTDNEKLISVPAENEGSDRATLLLAAAQSQDLDPGVITTHYQGAGLEFHAPESVVAEAFGKDHGYSEVESFDAEAPVAEQTTDYPAAHDEAALSNTVRGETDTPADGESPDADNDPEAEGNKVTSKRATPKKAVAKKSTTRKGSSR